ncbi:MAG TPA: toxin-antitoxin system HicB family antitoxin [Mycobacteriales bacterium]|jgi:predicted HicB family RNase H-like nuclease|nr:toxin-antitoxin system HicB family antitoxin [Mycobacteriales bacterium]
MQLEGYVQLLREDLSRVAALGEDTTARAAELLATALEPALGRRLQEALAEAALELSDQLPDGRAEVRIAGADPELVYVPDVVAAEPPSDEAFDARITLRLSERLKSLIDEAAAAASVSVNTWLVQVLNRALEPRPATTGQHRLTGYGRA